MKLLINHFPPITQRCEIDLSKKLTLFVGQNNSGKTYLSQLIWGINKYAMHYNHLKPFKFISHYKNKEYQVDLNTKLLKQLSKRFTEYILDEVINKLFKKDLDCDIKIIIEEKDIKNISFHYNEENISISKKYGSSIIEIKIVENKDLERINKDLEFILLLRIFQDTLFLPSNRLFLPSFYKYIFNIEKDFKDSMFNNLDKINKSNREFYAPSYTEPVDNLIKKLIFNIDKPIKDSKYLDILSHIIEGNISVDRAEELAMADISYNHKSGENIPMYLSSSMVNQLSTLYLYFKYWYNEDNSFLILDEPEMNLHPSKKIEVIELLMHFASSNKLLIATHSSTLAKSIINYIHLFDLKDKKDTIKDFIKENDLEMDGNINLRSNDIAIYYFNGKTITSYKQDDNSDIHFGTFTEIEKLQTKQYDYIMEALESYDS